MNFKNPGKSLLRNKKLIRFIARLAILLCFLGMMAALILFLKFNKDALSPREHRVELRSDGFYPNEISINKGDTVKFTTTLSENFWPASDPHPTHTIISGFDPRNAVPAGQSWSYKFEKTGKWRYHDHISPYFTGTIVVESAKAVGAEYDCAGEDNKQECWNEYLSLSVDKGGPKGGLDAISYLMENDSSFVDQGCHIYAHMVGEKSLAYYLARRADISSWELPIESTYCGYGFLHGLLEHYLREQPHLVFDVCNDLSKRFSTEIPAIRMNCFHGAGHGFMQDPPEAISFGNPELMISEPLKQCALIVPDDKNGEISQCNEGVFNIMAGWMMQGSYGLPVLDRDDPFKLCREQKTWPHQKACYSELSLKVNIFAEDDIRELAKKYVNGVKDDATARILINSMVAAVVQDTVSKTDFTDYVMDCRSLALRLRNDCMFAVVGGLMAHGAPGIEYVKPLALCSSDKINQTERDACYFHLSIVLPRTYAAEKIRSICPLFMENYRQACWP